MSSPLAGYVACFVLQPFILIKIVSNSVISTLTSFLSEALASFKIVRIEEMTLYAIIFTIIL